MEEEKFYTQRLRALEKSLPKRKTPVPLLLTPALPGRKKRKLLYRIMGIFIAINCIFICLPPFYWPARAPVTSEFFLRRKPDVRGFSLEIHHGIDIGAPEGSVVKTSGFGIVSTVGYNTELGNFVRVIHPLGISTLYAHLRDTHVKAGYPVIPGLSVIGRVGHTGRATGPHLHFGTFFMGQPFPPRLFLIYHSIRRWMMETLWG